MMSSISSEQTTAQWSIVLPSLTQAWSLTVQFKPCVVDGASSAQMTVTLSSEAKESWSVVSQTNRGALGTPVNSDPRAATPHELVKGRKTHGIMSLDRDDDKQGTKLDLVDKSDDRIALACDPPLNLPTRLLGSAARSVSAADSGRQQENNTSKRQQDCTEPSEQGMSLARHQDLCMSLGDDCDEYSLNETDEEDDGQKEQEIKRNKSRLRQDKTTCERKDVILDLPDLKLPSLWEYWPHLPEVRALKSDLFRLKDKILVDPRYYARRCSRGFYQAGAICFGHRFAYGSHRWDEHTKFPPVLQKLKAIGERLSGVKTDCALLKIYTNGEDSLGLHQDTDGSPQYVICFTFVDVLSALRVVEIYKSNNVGKMIKMFLPEDCSAWQFGGLINQLCAHRVRPAPAGERAKGCRITVSFRQAALLKCLLPPLDAAVVSNTVVVDQLRLSAAVVTDEKCLSAALITDEKCVSAAVVADEKCLSAALITDEKCLSAALITDEKCLSSPLAVSTFQQPTFVNTASTEAVRDQTGDGKTTPMMGRPLLPPRSWFAPIPVEGVAAVAVGSAVMHDISKSGIKKDGAIFHETQSNAPEGDNGMDPKIEGAAHTSSLATVQRNTSKSKPLSRSNHTETKEAKETDDINGTDEIREVDGTKKADSTQGTSETKGTDETKEADEMKEQGTDETKEDETNGCRRSHRKLLKRTFIDDIDWSAPGSKVEPGQKGARIDRTHFLQHLPSKRRRLLAAQVI